MKLTLENNIFYFWCLPHENEIARRAGFSWDKNLKVWATPFASIAQKVCRKDVVFPLLEEQIKNEQRYYGLSHAVDCTVKYKAPNNLEYLPYQNAGIKLMVERAHNLLADQMGLGKTVQVIGVCNELRARTALIICPASLKRNWIKEWDRWSICPEQLKLAEGNSFPQANYVVINYDILSKHRDAIKSVTWDVLVLDEVQYCKNKKAQRTLEIFGGRVLDKNKRHYVIYTPVKAKRVLALTGTPIVNRPIELFPVLNYLSPIAWPDKFSFAKRYCAAKRTRFGWDFTGASNLDELQYKLRSTLMIRRKKEDVLKDLPAKVRQVIELDGDDKTVLKKERETFGGLLDKDVLTEDEFRDVVKKMKHGSAGNFETMSTVRRLNAVSKIPQIIEHLHEAIEASGKVICFAHHKEVVEALYEEFKDVSVVVAGDTSMVNRQKNVEAFQGNTAVKLFIGNLIAAGTGITLTASNHVVFAEFSWVPGEVSQAEDRAHRIGQRNSVLVQHLVLAGSIDAVMAKTIISKQEVIDKALDTDPRLIRMLQ